MSGEMLSMGSSPRLWGTAIRPSARRIRTVHPHHEWGNSNAKTARRLSSGSSPQTWGNSLRPNQVNGEVGKSPRAWGRRHSPGQDGRLGRFIPTSVREAPIRSSLPRTVMGFIPTYVWGYRFTKRIPVTQEGTSPRLWGRPDGDQLGIAGMGFIPTPMGDTVEPFGGGPCSRVHPHMREGHGRVDWVMEGTGSSPRAWGRQRVFHQEPLPGGFIPTGVGGNESAPAHRARP